MSNTLWEIVSPEDIEAEADETSEEPAPTTINTEIPATPHTERDALYDSFAAAITHNPALDRSLVSFQANKTVPFYSWFKYREGFSESLVTYLLQKLHPHPGHLLDPFAGGGSSLFAASARGWQTEGIEVLPVGVYSMQARMRADHVDLDVLSAAIDQVLAINFADHFDAEQAPQHIAITKGAYPADEEQQLTGYLAYCRRHVEDENARALLVYAAFCILEDISYTRKDGQYLRWDARSGRNAGKRPFNKGRIIPFREAIEAKLHQMASDLTMASIRRPLFDEVVQQVPGPPPQVHEGSCLVSLPTMQPGSFDFVLTSPPYANRYDYTRTYALELVFLGCDAEQVKQLRQTMLSCTVENRDKRTQLHQYYQSLDRLQDFNLVDTTFQQQAALQEVLGILDRYRDEGKLNNENIARLVRNYFYEMCFVTFELARLLRPGGIVSMVNDNVRYAGEEVPADLILSDFARSFGLTVRHIWTLGRGKGNSSQQMGNHGRTELRKCVYVWEKQAPPAKIANPFTS